MDEKLKRVLISVVGNLVPLVGLFASNWTLVELIVLYWFENLVIGVFNFFEMLRSKGEQMQRTILSLFFAVHYGGFCFGHGMFLAVLLAISNNVPAERIDPSLGYLFSFLPSVFAFVAFLIAFNAFNYFTSKAQEFSFELMFAPYKRIVLIHVVIIALMFGLIVFPDVLTIHTSSAFVVIVVVKTVIDAYREFRQ